MWDSWTSLQLSGSGSSFQSLDGPFIKAVADPQRLTSCVVSVLEVFDAAFHRCAALQGAMRPNPVVVELPLLEHFAEPRVVQYEAWPELTQIRLLRALHLAGEMR